METKIRKEVKLTPQEVADIIRKHLQMPGASVNFRVGGHEDPTDFRAAQPLSYELDEIIVTRDDSKGV